MIKGVGTLIDAGVIIATGSAGLLVGKKMDSGLRNSLTQALGLLAMIIGVLMVVEGNELLILFISLIGGLTIGEMVELDRKFKKLMEGGESQLIKSFVMASLLSLVGPLAIVGSIQDGLGQGYQLLLYKSSLDGISTFMLSSVMGVGAVLAVIPVIIVQGLLTLLASIYSQLFSDLLVNGLISLGGVVLFAVGIDLLEIKKIKVINMLPGFLLVPVIILLLSLVGGI